jgi:hypothetical protein
VFFFQIHAPERTIVQRCVSLILCRKWKAHNQTACTVDWLCSKLTFLSPKENVTREQLTYVLNKYHACFDMSEDGTSVRVVNDALPERDASVVGADLVGILKQHGPLSFRRMLDLFNARRNDFICLNKHSAKKFVEDRSDLFRLMNGEVCLVGNDK